MGVRPGSARDELAGSTRLTPPVPIESTRLARTMALEQIFFPPNSITDPRDFRPEHEKGEPSPHQGAVLRGSGRQGGRIATPRRAHRDAPYSSHSHAVAAQIPVGMSQSEMGASVRSLSVAGHASQPLLRESKSTPTPGSPTAKPADHQIPTSVPPPTAHGRARPMSAHPGKRLISNSASLLGEPRPRSAQNLSEAHTASANPRPLSGDPSCSHIAELTTTANPEPPTKRILPAQPARRPQSAHPSSRKVGAVVSGASSNGTSPRQQHVLGQRAWSARSTNHGTKTTTSRPMSAQPDPVTQLAVNPSLVQPHKQERAQSAHPCGPPGRAEVARPYSASAAVVSRARPGSAASDVSFLREVSSQWEVDRLASDSASWQPALRVLCESSSQAPTGPPKSGPPTLQLRVPASLAAVAASSGEGASGGVGGASEAWQHVPLPGAPSSRAAAAALTNHLAELLKDSPNNAPGEGAAERHVQRLQVIQSGMAELAGQVGQHCLERAQCLLLLWNATHQEYDQTRRGRETAERATARQLEEARARCAELDAEVARQRDANAALAAELASARLSEASVRRRLDEAEIHLEKKIAHQRWRLAGRSPDLVKVRSIPLVKGGPPNPSGAASRAESGASEGVAREVVPLDPPNEVMRAIAELEELNADANVHYKEQCRMAALVKWAPLGAEIADLRESRRKTTLALKSLGLGPSSPGHGDDQDPDLFLDLLAGLSDGDTRAAARRASPLALARLLPVLDPAMAAAVLKALTPAAAASALCQLSVHAREAVLACAAEDVVAAALLDGSDLLKGLPADSAARALQLLEPEAAADALAQMEAEQAGAVLRLLDLSFAVDVIREWAPKTAADALAHVPHALAADLLACVPNDAVARVLDKLPPRAGADVLSLLDPSKAAGSLVSVSSAVQRSVVGRLQLHELQAVLSKLSHAQQALVFMAMAPDRQRAVVEALAREEVEAAALVAALVALATQLDQIEHEDPSAPLPGPGDSAAEGLPSGDSLATRNRRRRRSTVRVSCHSASVIGAGPGSSSVALAVDRVTPAVHSLVLRRLTPARKVRMLESLGAAGVTALVRGVVQLDPEAVTTLCVEMAHHLPALLPTIADALEAEVLISVLQTPPLIEQANVVACLTAQQALTFLSEVSVDQREALVVCLELNHPAQLQLLRKLQKQQVKEMDAGAARGDRWHGTGAAANRRLASSPRGTSGKGGWGSGDEQARVSLRVKNWSDGQVKRKSKGGRSKKSLANAAAEVDPLGFRDVPQEPSKPISSKHGENFSREELSYHVQTRVAHSHSPATLPPPASWEPPPIYIFNPKDERLQGYLVMAEHFQPGTREWLLEMMDSVLKDKVRRDRHLAKCGFARTTLPDALIVFLHAQADQELGLGRDEFLYQTQLTDDACTLMQTLKKFEHRDERVRALSFYLAEEWSLPNLDMHLEALRLCELRRREAAEEGDVLSGLWTDYEPPINNTRDAWVCLRKAHLIALHLLRPRSVQTTAAFHAKLTSRSVPAAAEDVRKFLASNPGFKGDPPELFKIQRGALMVELGLEWARCERLETVGMCTVFRGWDISVDGRLSQREILNLASAVLHATGLMKTNPTHLALQMWNLAWAADAAQGLCIEGQVSVTLQGWRSVVAHVPVVRDYLRLMHTGPPAPQCSDGLLHALDQFLHAATRRHLACNVSIWRSLLPQVALEEPLVRSFLGHAADAQSGCAATTQYLLALKTMCTSFFDQLFGSLRQVRDREVDESVEVEEWMIQMDDRLRHVEDAVQLMYSIKGAVLRDINDPYMVDRRLASVPPFLRRHVMLEQLEVYLALRPQYQNHAARLIQKRWRKCKEHRAKTNALRPASKATKRRGKSARGPRQTVA